VGTGTSVGEDGAIDSILSIALGGVPGIKAPSSISSTAIKSSGVGGSDSPASVGTGISRGELGNVEACLEGVVGALRRGGSSVDMSTGDDAAGDVGAASVGTGISVGVDGAPLLLPSVEGAATVPTGTSVTSVPGSEIRVVCVDVGKDTVATGVCSVEGIANVGWVRDGGRPRESMGSVGIEDNDSVGGGGSSVAVGACARVEASVGGASVVTGSSVRTERAGREGGGGGAGTDGTE